MEHRIPTRVGELFVRERGTGPALVFWHSMFVDGRMFDAQVDELASAHRCLVIDAPGHGRSGSPPRRFQIRECAQAAETILSALDVERPHFVGCAFGGHVGVTLAVERPTLLESLVVFNAPMQPVTGPDRIKLAVLVALYGLLGPKDFIVDAAVEALLHPALVPQHGHYIRQCLREADRGAMLLAMRSAMLGRKSLVHRLPEVRVPALFVTSDSDATWTPALAREHAALLPHGQIEIVTGSRHLTPLEDPDTTHRLLRSWLTPDRTRQAHPQGTEQPLAREAGLAHDPLYGWAPTHPRPRGGTP